MLFDFLQSAASARNGRWSSSIRATITRALYMTFWYRREWMRFFDVGDMPTPDMRALGEWIASGENGDLSWSLAEHQRKERKKKGKGREGGEAPGEPGGSGRRGRVCGKTLVRFDRTYTCK